MNKALGSLLILIGGFILRWIQLRERKRIMERLNGLLAALDRMQTEIRVRRTALPEVFSRLESLSPPEIGQFFCTLRNSAKSGQLSPPFWREQVYALPVPEAVKEILDRLSSCFRGDEAAALRAIQLAGEQLRRELDNMAAADSRERQRISVCTLSAAIFLMILLC